MSARDKLRERLRERDAVAARVHAAEQAVARADKVVAEAEAEVTAIGDVRGELVAHHVERIRAGQRPSVSPELSARRRRKTEAVDTLDAARAARDALASEAEAARTEHKRATWAASQAAAAVLAEEAEQLAARLRDARRQVWQLTDQLHGLTPLWVFDLDGRQRAVRLPASVVETLANDQPPQLPPVSLPSPRTVALERWRAYHAALLADPEATYGAS